MAHIKKYFDSVDRFLNFLALIFGIVSVILTIVMGVNSSPVFIVIRDLSVLAVLGITILILSWKYFRREVTIERLTSRLDRLDDVGQSREEYLQRITASFVEVLLSNHGQKITKSPVVAKDELKYFRSIMIRLTIGLRDGLKQNFLARGFDIGEDIAIAVKVFQSDVQMDGIIAESKVIAGSPTAMIDDDLQVMTIFRDPTTYATHPEREVNKKMYSVVNNSAFSAVLLKGQSSFMHNDLNYLGVTYENKNPDWKKYYHATMVVPIGRPGSRSGEWKVYGVLAADSLNPKKLEIFNESCLPLMNQVADLLALYFLLFESGDENIAPASD